MNIEVAIGIAILLSAIIFGTGGNLLIIFAVWKKRSLRSTTSYLLVNLAISDITSLIFLPLILLQSVARHMHGTISDFLCKFLISYHVPLTASFAFILTLAVLSVQRYHAVVKPMMTGIRLQKETVKYAIAAVWLIAVMLTSPYYIFGKYGAGKGGKAESCRYNVSLPVEKIYALHLLAIFIFIPFHIISFCYFQIVHELFFKKKVRPQNIEAQEDTLRNKKLFKLSLSITLAFVCCFFPSAIAVIMRSVLAKDKFDGIKYIRFTSSVYFCEAALNPVLYAFQSSNFCRAFKEILTNILKFKPLR